jgi:murein DD-endopeptidase MepM/ murein hydrolase activator NlpD
LKPAALAVLLSALFSAVAAPVRADCSNEWLCVDVVDENGDVGLRARNLGDFPITYTLNVRSFALNSGGRKSVTGTLAPRQSENVLLLSDADVNRHGDLDFTYEWAIGDKDAVHDDDHLYALPYSSGRSYRVLQGYGSRFSHTGLEEFAIDFDMKTGTAVHAARAGVVARVEESHSVGCWEDGCGRYANYIVIVHSDGTTGEYYHLKHDGAIVGVGNRVSQGQKIGYSGNTGHTTMPHLHFAVYRATTGGNTQSIPVRFQGVEGIITRLRRGGRYEAM